MNDKDLRRVGKAERELFKKLCKKTHADHIRTMSDEELAETFAEIADCVVCETMMNADCRLHHGQSSCRDCWLDLLRKEVT